MRRVVLQFWTSLDGYSCDEGTELSRLLQVRASHCSRTLTAR